MTIQFMLIYLLVFGVGLSSILVCGRMVKKYQVKYLSSYLYFLITINIAALYGDVPENFAAFFGNSPQIMKMGGVLTALLGTPMLLTAGYMFANLISRLLDRKLSKTFKILYFIFFGCIFIMQVLLTTHYFETGHDRLLKIFIGYSLKVYIIIFLGIIGYMFLKVKELPDGKKRKILRFFGGFYTILFSFMFCYSISHCLLSGIPQNLFLLLFFTWHFLPLLYLQRFLKQQQAELLSSGLAEDGKGLETFLSTYNISFREREIIDLLLKGKSNKEIEDKLFISINTVRNHIYNIYRKLGVRNRVELVNFIRIALKNRPGI
jgi:DNA-binding CsgD family transcriptional regulator